jgi:TolB-like protein/DNA-binding winged helix-turn-helix (wHTH) protein/Flp pilus assembly protein TadD
MSSEPAVPGWLAFDAVEIDTLGHRVFVGGKEVALERKAFAVLVLLAREPGRVFTRDQILDTLWGHSHVTPGVLNRIVTLLRQALGESGGENRYLHTVHGVGYRFDADVRFNVARPHASGELSAQGVLGSAGSPAPALAVHSIASSDDGEGPAHADPIPASSGDRRARVAWPRVAALVVLVIVLATVSALILSHDWHAADRSATPPSTIHRGSLIVLPLHTIGGASEDVAFAEGLGEELISVLARVDGLHVIAHTSAMRVQQSGEDLAGIAQRLGISHALEGSMRHEGDQLRVSLRLTEIASGRTLWTEQYDHAARDVFALERDVARSVSAALALKLDAQVQVELAREGDPVLYRRYLEARRLSRRGSPREKGIAAFRSLIADAPNYARAHGGLALVLLRSGTPEETEARSEAERALALDPMSADAKAALGFLACRSDEWEHGLALTQRALEQAPADTSIRLGYGICLAFLGYLPAGLEQVRAAQAVDPFSDEANVVLATVLDTMGRHDEAATYLARAPKATSEMWFNAMWRGNFAQARTSMATRHDRWTTACLAVIDAVEDISKWPAARAAIDASEQNDGAPDGARNWARIFDPNADVALDIGMLENVRHRGLGPASLWLWSGELVNHRRHRAFEAYLRRTNILDYWRAHGWPAQCKPDGDGVLCD